MAPVPSPILVGAAAKVSRSTLKGPSLAMAPSPSTSRGWAMEVAPTVSVDPVRR